VGERVEEPNGTVWDVDASRLPWRPRRRRIGDLDPVGVVLFFLSLPLIVVEWVVANVVAAVRPRTVVIATTEGPPTRRLTWKEGSRDAAVAKAREVVRRLRAGEELSEDADDREVGA